VLQRQELVVIQRMREACHVPGDKDIIGDHAVDIKRPAAGVAAHPPDAGGQT
jgi:hypothetical protein